VLVFLPAIDYCWQCLDMVFKGVPAFSRCVDERAWFANYEGLFNLDITCFPDFLSILPILAIITNPCPIKAEKAFPVSSNPNGKKESVLTET